MSAEWRDSINRKNSNFTGIVINSEKDKIKVSNKSNKQEVINMSNYFDNQSNWSWNISDKDISVTTDHGDHTHTIDLSKVTFGDMLDRCGQTMGDAHRDAPHDKK